jgi:predicted amidohydrolase
MTSNRTVRVAVAQYPIGELATFEAFEAKLSAWVSDATSNGAELLVFPEYGALELTRLAGRLVARDLGQSVEALQFYLDAYRELHERLSKRHGVFVLAGSAAVVTSDGRTVNRARLFSPGGKSGYQNKHIMTRFEAEEWHVSLSHGLCVFDIGLCKVGIAICYDAEFPLLCRALAEAGADLILVPSCTDTLAGYHRVRLSCAARALENQVYIAMACTVGDAAWSAALDTNVGAAGVFAPPDMSLSPTGVIAEGTLNAPQWVYATLDFDRLVTVRREGEVLNRQDWAQQERLPTARDVKLVEL